MTISSEEAKLIEETHKVIVRLHAAEKAALQARGSANKEDAALVKLASPVNPVVVSEPNLEQEVEEAMKDIMVVRPSKQVRPPKIVIKHPATPAVVSNPNLEQEVKDAMRDIMLVKPASKPVRPAKVVIHPPVKPNLEKERVQQAQSKQRPSTTHVVTQDISQIFAEIEETAAGIIKKMDLHKR